MAQSAMLVAVCLGSLIPGASAAGLGDEDVAAALQLPVQHRPRGDGTAAREEFEVFVAGLVQNATASARRPCKAKGLVQNGSAPARLLCEVTPLEKLLKIVDTREVKVGSTAVMPFVFDKILARSAALGDALVTDSKKLLAAVVALNSDDVLKSNKIMDGLYQPTSIRKWVDINGRFTEPNFGESPRRRAIIKPDKITSRQLAFDMLVVHARSLTRDVPLAKWGEEPTTTAIAKALDSVFQANRGSINPLMPLVYGRIVGRNLFRGVFVDEELGFFWNQLQMFPTQTGLSNTPEPRVYYPEQDATGYVTKQGFLDQQEGRRGFEKLIDPARTGVISTPRQVIGFVHNDVLEGSFREAVDILLRTSLTRQSIFDGRSPKLAIGTEIFYSETGCGFMKGILVGVIRSGLVAAWNNKYSFLRIRPEKLAYFWNLLLKEDRECSALSAPERELREALLRSGYFDEHLEVLRSPGGRAIMEMVRENNLKHNLADPNDEGSSISEPYLLMPLFPEGSPTHASYVGGHSVASGVLATSLKMFFDMYEEDGKTFRKWSDVIPSAYDDSFSQATIKALWADPGAMGKFYAADDAGDVRAPLRPGTGKLSGKYVVDASADAASATVVGEIHKLAAQYTHSRDWAGVHYGTDGFNGMYLGQSVAIRYMQQVLRGLPSAGVKGLDNSITFPTFDGKKVTLTADAIVCEGRSYAEPEYLYPEEVASRLMNPRPSLSRRHRGGGGAYEDSTAA